MGLFLLFAMVVGIALLVGCGALVLAASVMSFLDWLEERRKKPRTR